jgi:hypothetical protein
MQSQLKPKRFNVIGSFFKDERWSEQQTPGAVDKEARLIAMS